MKRTASALIILAATTGFAFAQRQYQGSEKGPVSHPDNKLRRRCRTALRRSVAEQPGDTRSEQD